MRVLNRLWELRFPILVLAIGVPYFLFLSSLFVRDVTDVIWIAAWCLALVPGIWLLIDAAVVIHYRRKILLVAGPLPFFATFFSGNTGWDALKKLEIRSEDCIRFAHKYAAGLPGYERRSSIERLLREKGYSTALDFIRNEKRRLRGLEMEAAEVKRRAEQKSRDARSLLERAAALGVKEAVKKLLDNGLVDAARHQVETCEKRKMLLARAEPQELRDLVETALARSVDWAEDTLIRAETLLERACRLGIADTVREHLRLGRMHLAEDAVGSAAEGQEMNALATGFAKRIKELRDPVRRNQAAAALAQFETATTLRERRMAEHALRLHFRE